MPAETQSKDLLFSYFTHTLIPSVVMRWPNAVEESLPIFKYLIIQLGCRIRVEQRFSAAYCNSLKLCHSEGTSVPRNLPFDLVFPLFF